MARNHGIDHLTVELDALTVIDMCLAPLRPQPLVFCLLSLECGRSARRIAGAGGEARAPGVQRSGRLSGEDGQGPSLLTREGLKHIIPTDVHGPFLSPDLLTKLLGSSRHIIWARPPL